MDDNELDEMHHEHCYVRSMAHVFKEPECNCPIRLVRELEAERERLRHVLSPITGVLDALNDPKARIRPSMSLRRSLVEQARAALHDR